MDYIVQRSRRVEIAVQFVATSFIIFSVAEETRPPGTSAYWTRNDSRLTQRGSITEWAPEHSLSSWIQRKLSTNIRSPLHSRVNEFSMTNFESRPNVQLRLLGQTRCVHDLININRVTREIKCNICINSENAHHDVVYRHRISVGPNIDAAICSVCTRSLSFSRPAYYCSSCFKIALDFLSSRSNSELAGIDCSTEPHIIMLEQHCINYIGLSTE